MKEDYLWDKTGTDPEIEKLEIALQAFRYQESIAPALPAKVVSLKKEPFYGFRFALAAAACVAFGILALAVWFQVLRNNIEVNDTVAKVNTTEQNITSLPDSYSAAVDNQPVKNADKTAVEKIKFTKRFSAPKIKRSDKTSALLAQQNETRAQKIKNAAPEIRLTKEEKFAYDQLMLALSITSSKLKIVKDKVEGLDEKSTVLKNGQ
jgi:hypothetical protein